MMFGFVVYMIWGTATEQSWNFFVDDPEHREGANPNEKDEQFETLTEAKRKKNKKEAQKTP